LDAYCQKEGYAYNTTSQLIKSIKTVCYHAQANGIEVSHQLANLPISWEKVEKIYLTTEDLEKIRKAKLETESLENARDWLLISCETGQRVSDFMRFKKEMIRIQDGKTVIDFTQVKTKKHIPMPLSKKVLTILQKRNGEFPRAISDQRYNEYIKDVCKIAGLTQKIKGSIKDPETERKVSGTFEKWQLVSSHIGRRSFSSNNYGKIPTALLIGATGHSSERLFLEYIGKSDAEKNLELSRYF
jgi:hypothetical protein